MTGIVWKWLAFGRQGLPAKGGDRGLEGARLPEWVQIRSALQDVVGFLEMIHRYIGFCGSHKHFFFKFFLVNF